MKFVIKNNNSEIMNIGNVISLRRKELGLTLEQVGNAVGVGKSTVKKWEDGFIKNIKSDKLVALSEILNTDIFSLLMNDDISEHEIKPDYTNNFLYNLDYLIFINKLNKSQLAKRSGIPYTTIIGLYERGAENAQVSTIIKLANFFNITIESLIYGSVINMSVGKKIQNARKNKQLKQQELAKLIGVTASAIGNYEANYSFPKPEVLYKLFDVLDIDANYLFQEHLPKNKNYPTALSAEEERLFANYNNLNDIGKCEAQKRMLELTQIKSYTINKDAT